MASSALLANSADPDAAELIAARPCLARHAMDGLLFEGAPLAGIAREYGTPCFVYGAATLQSRFRRLRAAMGDISIHYAVKANDHLAVLSLLEAEGAGADVVSGGEILRCLKAGIAGERIVFSGVGKTADEMRLALGCGVSQINVESAEEIAQLSQIASGMGRVARIALRVNPDVDAGTHDKISTGRSGDKFGVPFDDAASLYARAAGLPGIEPIGLAVHIGSQIRSTAPFLAAYRKLAVLVRSLRAQGLAVRSVDCGGGLGIAYRDEPAALPEAWAGAIRVAFDGLDLDLSIEPGRWLVGPAGLLLSAVVRTRREGMARPIVVLDAAMNDLIRPAMYGAWHGIVPVGAADLVRPGEGADVVGPVCESGDIFARNRSLPALAPGALVAILDAGAYSAVMSSTYNSRPHAAQVLVHDGVACLIRARQAPEALWQGEMVPA